MRRQTAAFEISKRPSIECCGLAPLWTAGGSTPAGSTTPTQNRILPARGRFCALTGRENPAQGEAKCRPGIPITTLSPPCRGGRIIRRGDNGVFVLTGSHQFELHESVSQSLAGRTTILRSLPLTIGELSRLTSDLEVDEMLVGGFMPRIYDQSIPHTQALSDYVATYVERDLRQLVAIRNLDTFERFLGLCAGRVGQLLNLSGLGNDAGVSHTTVREWVNLLQASYILFTLPPYYRNVGKRLIKSPKLYFHDVGLAEHLAGINSPEQMKTHPLRGGFFENLVVGEALKWQTNRGMKPSLHFFRDSSGNEVGLLFQESGHFLPVEIKSGQTVVRDFFKGLNAFHSIEPDLPLGSMLVYGGEQRRKQREVTITTPRHFTADVGKLVEGGEGKLHERSNTPTNDKRSRTPTF